MTPVKIMSAGQPVGKKRLVSPQRRSAFYGSVHGCAFPEYRLVLSELLSSERLLLGSSHGWRVIAWAVQRRKHEARLCHVFHACHHHIEVSVTDSS